MPPAIHPALPPVHETVSLKEVDEVGEGVPHLSPTGRGVSARSWTREGAAARPFSASYSSTGFHIEEDEDALSVASHGTTGAAAVASALLTGGTGRSPAVSSSRPPGVSSLLSELLDAAHWQQATRKLSHPVTPAYSAFDSRQQEVCEANGHFIATKRVGEWAAFLKSTPNSVLADALPSQTSSGSSDGGTGGGPMSPNAFGGTGGFAASATSQFNPELEIVCQYDGNFQAADIQGRDGSPVRPLRQPGIGPVAYLFRWYTKRGSDASSIPSVAQTLTDTPTMPPPDLLPTEATPKVLRHLCQMMDPVMSLSELTDMAEELDLVPDLLCRRDILQAFRASRSVPQPAQLTSAVLRGGQPHPDEVRYPQFCDVLIRLALAVAAAVAGEAATAESAVMTMAQAEEAVGRLMDKIGLSKPAVHELKVKLDALTRTASERCCRKVDEKRKYVAATSVFDARFPPSLSGGWTVNSPAPAPEALVRVLLQHDVAAADRYTADWRVFSVPSLALGRVQPGELRSLRLVLRNRGERQVLVRIDATRAPWLRLMHGGNGGVRSAAAASSGPPLAPGVQRVINIEVRLYDVDEYIGELRVYTRVRESDLELCNTVPFYALCGPADNSGRAVPRSRGGRTDLASRAGTARRVPRLHTTASKVLNHSISMPVMALDDGVALLRPASSHASRPASSLGRPVSSTAPRPFSLNSCRTQSARLGSVLQAVHLQLPPDSPRSEGGLHSGGWAAMPRGAGGGSYNEAFATSRTSLRGSMEGWSGGAGGGGFVGASSSRVPSAGGTPPAIPFERCNGSRRHSVTLY